MTFVVQDLSPLLEALVRGDHGRGMLVASVDELEEQDGAAAGDREVADLVHDQERGVREGFEPVVEATGCLGLFKRVDEVGQRSVVDPAAALGRGDGQTDRQVRPCRRRAGRGRRRSPSAPGSRARGASRSAPA